MSFRHTPEALDYMLFLVEELQRKMRSMGMVCSALHIQESLRPFVEREYEALKKELRAFDTQEELDDELLNLIGEAPRKLNDLNELLRERSLGIATSSTYNLISKRLGELRKRGRISYQQKHWMLAQDKP